MLQIGKTAPDFTLPTGDGTKVRLKQFRGKPVVLYFYPADDTPGCTREACSFRDEYAQFTQRGAVVLGVSADSVESHRAFATKYHLPFPLLSDESKRVLKKYGVWKRKTLYGRTFMGIVRTTVVINPKGKVFEVFPNVRVDGHTQQVLEALDRMLQKE
jgi:peroxiredoxin Q/BCP